MNLKNTLFLIIFFQFYLTAQSQSFETERVLNFKLNTYNSDNSSLLNKPGSYEEASKSEIKLNLNRNIKIRKFVSPVTKIYTNSKDDDTFNPTWFIDAGGGYLNEIEENYSTASIYQKYGINKIFSDKFNLGLITRIEYAKREEVESPDITRWYDNTTLNANYAFNPFNNVSLFAGASISDTTFTTYGLTYNSVIENEDFAINNKLTLSDDYFYYWNQVTQIFASDNVSFNYKNLKIAASAFFGVVDFDYIENYEAKARNPNTLFSFEVQYLVLPDPAVKVGVALSARNFKYRSPLYYSPSNKNQVGVFTNLYKSFGRIYFYLGGSTNVDNQNTFIWSVDSELGYDYNNFSASIGLGRYNDPYYTNYNTFINLSKNF